MKPTTVEAPNRPITVHSNKGMSAPNVETAPIAAIIPVVETRIKTAVKAKSEWAIKKARSPETVEASVGVPKPTVSNWIVTGRVL